MIGSLFELLFLIFLVSVFFYNGDGKILSSLIFISLVLIIFIKIFKTKLKRLGSSRILIGKKLHSILFAILNLYKENTLLEKRISLIKILFLRRKI